MVSVPPALERSDGEAPLEHPETSAAIATMPASTDADRRRRYLMDNFYLA